MCISHTYFSVYYLTLVNFNDMNAAQPSAILNDGDSNNNATHLKTTDVHEDKDKTTTTGCAHFFFMNILLKFIFIIVFLLFLNCL